MIAVSLLMQQAETRIEIIHTMGHVYATRVVEEIEVDGTRGYFQVRDNATGKLVPSSEGTGPACFVSLQLAQRCAGLR